MVEFHYLLMSSSEFLKDNVLEEVLRERAAYYLAKNRKQDFWVIKSPKFLSHSKILKEFRNTIFFKQKKSQNYYALVSSDKVFIDWLALRIGYFESLCGPDKSKIGKLSINGILGNTKLINPLISLRK